MRGRSAVVAVVSVLAVFATACTSSLSANTSASPTPAASPSAASSPSAPPSASPSSVASPSAAPSANGLAVASIATHNGEVGVIYLAVTLQASGGTPPYTWSGSGLPPGLSVSPQGVVTGNNTAAGKFNFSVTVTDSTGATATGKQAMTVFPPLTVSQPCAQICYVGMGCASCGRFGTVTGGAGPYHYKLAGGTVPPGMTLNGFALQGAFPVPVAGPPVDVIVAGPPITKLLWGLSASVTDDFGVTKTVAANFWEFFPLLIQCTNSSPCSCDNGTTTCSAVAAYQFGSPSDNVTVQVVQVCDANGGNCVAGTAGLPAGWVATAKGGAINVAWNTGVAFTNQVTIDLVDHGACVSSQYAVSPTQVLTIFYAP